MSIIKQAPKDINALNDICEIIVPIEDSVVDGVYTRIAYAKAGTMIVGCTHKKGGTATLLKGKIKQIDGEQKYEISAPQILNTQAGTQRIAYAMTDCVYATMHSVNAKTCEEAEKEIFEQEPQITRIKNSFKKMLLENNTTKEDIQKEMDSLEVYYEPSNTYFVGDSIIDGKGSIANKDILIDESVGMALVDGKRLPLARYVNHSDFPNAKFIDRDNGDIELVATKVIPIGNEILVDYRERNFR